MSPDKGSRDNPLLVDASPVRQGRIIPALAPARGSRNNPMLVEDSPSRIRNDGDPQTLQLRSGSSTASRAIHSRRVARMLSMMGGGTWPIDHNMPINRALIIGGPPSAILQEGAPSLRGAELRDARREAQLLNCRPIAESAVPFVPQPRVRRWVPPFLAGEREPRVRALKHEDLWREGLGPEDMAAKEEHHKCGICKGVKSHPVSYVCGHSHCFVCSRLWLEKKWTCPECVTPMYIPPFRQYGEEAHLASAYPGWDRSRVDYNWDSLIFPQRFYSTELLNEKNLGGGISISALLAETLLCFTPPISVHTITQDEVNAATGILGYDGYGSGSLQNTIITKHQAPVPLSRFALSLPPVLPPSNPTDGRAGRRRGGNFDITVDVDEGEAAADLGIYYSADGRRRTEEMLNITHKKRRLEPQQLDDTYTEWIPVPEDDMESANDNAELDLLDAVVSNPEAPEQRGKKRKSYASSDNPMSLWRPLKALFLNEILRHAGLADEIHNPKCADCHARYDSVGNVRLFKCQESPACYKGRSVDSGVFESPANVLDAQEWTGDFWTDRTLTEIGLVYQMGHGGLPCICPSEKTYKMTVIKAPVLHQLNIRYCACSRAEGADSLRQLLRNGWYPATVTDPATCATFKSLETYRLYNVGTGTCDEHYGGNRVDLAAGSIQAVSANGTRMGLPGGEASVKCWTCPYDQRNLPPDWRDVAPGYRFLYMLLLAVDANFKLKNRMRPNEIDDPSLGPGWGYWVEPQRYKKHLRKYVAEKDASTCIAFAALLQKDTRLMTGLRASGVGGCVCARHEVVRPNGIGDLQKGERYANMDYIIMSALIGFNLMLLTISYDIACQWKKKLPERMGRLPKKLQLSLKEFTFQCALPVWHAGSHNEDCKNDNSLSFKRGVGTSSDGEGVERTWAVLNPVSYHTRDAGQGQRVDVLEDKIDNHNFLKNIGQGDALQRKLIVAIAERARQVAEFRVVSSAVSQEVRREWKQQIADWEEDPSKPNPYTLNRKDCPSEAEVRLALRKEEEEAAAAGAAPLHGTSATAFLTAGIQIEDAQRRIIPNLGDRALVTADRKNKIQEWRHMLLVKINKFRSSQRVYMPGATTVIEAAEAARDEDLAPLKAEKIQLFMPCDMPTTDTLRGCVRGLLDMESKLRVAQCDNTLVLVRARLHAKGHLIYFRNANVAGQNKSTKAATLIGQVGERVDAAAKKYSQGRASLTKLKGADYMPQFRKLQKTDLQLDGDARESDAAARKKLAMIGLGRGARARRNAPGTSKRVMSWIWMAPGALDDAEERLHDSVRVEWARAHARKIRWEEEVLLLREEMRRVLRYLGWQADWWRQHATGRSGLEEGTAAGLRAYAVKQAAWHVALAKFFEEMWKMLVLQAAQHLVAWEGATALEGADLDEFFSQHSGGPVVSA
ncbi:hypothetical protein B0H16DRAFT_1737899 [Mycena metata]|uniref:RING-type domain-containing protein n=1 Tax=Mycena metata TaxID=1033252 RepID=A0AAD7HKS7_9AGAR|nr:hypothetical protein B0H16DRAFT_1737899 [Mycena metata]